MYLPGIFPCRNAANRVRANIVPSFKDRDTEHKYYLILKEKFKLTIKDK